MVRRNKVVVAKVDSTILRSDEMIELKKQYRETFGERFMPFNYCDFQRDGDRCAAQVWISLNSAYTRESPALSFPNGASQAA